jgi:hypothetical protein
LIGMSIIRSPIHTSVSWCESVSDITHWLYVVAAMFDVFVFITWLALSYRIPIPTLLYSWLYVLSNTKLFLFDQFIEWISLIRHFRHNHTSSWVQFPPRAEFILKRYGSFSERLAFSYPVLLIFDFGIRPSSLPFLLAGVLVWTQHLNGKYYVSSRPSVDRHTKEYGMCILRHRPHESYVAIVAVVSLLWNKNSGETLIFLKKKRV